MSYAHYNNKPPPPPPRPHSAHAPYDGGNSVDPDSEVRFEDIARLPKSVLDRKYCAVCDYHALMGSKEQLESLIGQRDLIEALYYSEHPSVQQSTKLLNDVWTTNEKTASNIVELRGELDGLRNKASVQLLEAKTLEDEWRSVEQEMNQTIKVIICVFVKVSNPAVHSCGNVQRAIKCATRKRGSLRSADELVFRTG
jgi:hypothetical protein